MHNTKNGNKRLLSMSRVAPKRDTEEMERMLGILPLCLS